MKVYETVFKDRENAYREVIPAKGIKELKDQWGGNGELIYIKDVTTEYGLLTLDGLEQLADTLKRNLYGQDEINIIIRSLRNIFNI